MAAGLYRYLCRADVRALLNIRDVATFQRFVQLRAGRCGQLLNLNSLAEDAGINRATAQSWMRVLQASHLVVLIQPWSTNLSEQFPGRNPRIV